MYINSGNSGEDTIKDVTEGDECIEEEGSPNKSGTIVEEEVVLGHQIETESGEIKIENDEARKKRRRCCRGTKRAY